MILAYDGTAFHGWQRQVGLRTVQEEFEQVLQRVVRHPVHSIASGRTDAGVHAEGQVVNFKTDCPIESAKLLHAIGSRLPSDISLRQVRDVPLLFHATGHAIRKLYRYRIINTPIRPFPWLLRYVHHIPRFELDVERMGQAAQSFVGTHDFRSMTPIGGPPRRSYVRTVFSCCVSRQNEEILIDVEGSGFLYNQVRNMVGTLTEVGRGHWPPEQVLEILESKDRTRAGPTAPPQGLCLRWVKYPPDDQLPDLEQTFSPVRMEERDNPTLDEP